jgi:Protein of unknown function (DUF541)
MNVSRRFPAHLLIALAAAALVLVIGAAAAFGQDSAPTAAGTVTAVPAPSVSGGSGIAAPAWCCGTYGSVPGLTTIGQGTVERDGPAARDAAIAAAVQDATAQAKAAADAAGISLGAIVDMQVSAMPYFYPMMGAAEAGSLPGSTGGGVAVTKPAPAPDQYFGSVSVTITWSLG